MGIGSYDHVSFCSDNAVLTRDGVSRVFAGEEVAATEVPVESNVVVNGKAFVAVPGDNLLSPRQGGLCGREERQRGR